MSILVPPPAIAARWNGALNSRLRRAPLETFLRSRALPFITKGPAQLTDNLARATVVIVTAGIEQYAAQRKRPLNERQFADIARMSCVISDDLAALIREPQSWRIAALVSSAQLLRRHIGLSAAAHLSAGIARTYETDRDREGPVSEIGVLSALAVETNDESRYAAACSLIAELLTAGQDTVGPARPARPFYDFEGATFISSTT